MLYNKDGDFEVHAHVGLFHTLSQATMKMKKMHNEPGHLQPKIRILIMMRNWKSSCRRTLGMVKRKTMNKNWTGQVVDQLIIDKESTIRRMTQKYVNVKSRITWGCSLCNNQWIATVESVVNKLNQNQR